MPPSAQVLNANEPMKLLKLMGMGFGLMTSHAGPITHRKILSTLSYPAMLYIVRDSHKKKKKKNDATTYARSKNHELFNDQLRVFCVM